MYKMFNNMRNWLARLLAREAATGQGYDPLSRMDVRELADLPVHHPRCDPCN